MVSAMVCSPCRNCSYHVPGEGQEVWLSAGLRSISSSMADRGSPGTSGKSRSPTRITKGTRAIRTAPSVRSSMTSSQLESATMFHCVIDIPLCSGRPLDRCGTLCYDHINRVLGYQRSVFNRTMCLTHIPAMCGSGGTGN